jgi:hypothetical protein
VSLIASVSRKLAEAGKSGDMVSVMIHIFLLYT